MTKVFKHFKNPKRGEIKENIMKIVLPKESV